MMGTQQQRIETENMVLRGISQWAQAKYRSLERYLLYGICYERGLLLNVSNPVWFSEIDFSSHFEALSAVSIQVCISIIVNIIFVI